MQEKKHLAFDAEELTFTHNNHLRYRLEKPQAFGEPQAFVGKIGTCEYWPRLPIEEAKRASRLIHEAAPSRIVLCLSGGADSEAMAIAFKSALVPFTAVVMRFQDGWNDFDTADAFEFIKRLDINYETIDIDIKDFYESGKHLRYLEEFDFKYPELASHLWLAEQIDGTPVFAGNPLLAMRTEREAKLLMPDYNFMCYNRFFQKTNRFGVGHFFLYTAELAMSFVRLPRFQNFFYGPITGQLGPYSYDFKISLYNDGGFPISARKAKYTGFERIRRYYVDQLGMDWNKDFGLPQTGF